MVSLTYSSYGTLEKFSLGDYAGTQPMVVFSIHITLLDHN